MKEKLKYIVFILGFLILLSCSEDIPNSDESNIDRTSDIPVEFLVEEPTSFNGTKGVANPKTYFTENDIIHIEAIFYDNEDKIIEGEHYYKMIQLNSSGVWKQLTGEESIMFWPIKAEKGIFKAYYIANLVESLEAGEIAREFSLSSLKDDADPLYAECEVEWGHRVNLQFSHLCTHLTFTNLEPDITDYFWLVNKGEPEYHNTFQIERTTDNELVMTFVSRGDDSYNGLVYVEQPSEHLLDEKGNKIGSKVGFFLAPDEDYSDIELKTNNNHSYLAFKNIATAKLEPGQAYVIDITNNKGIIDIPDEEPWDENEDNTVTIVEPNEFIDHITGTLDGDYYIEDENGKHLILEKTSNGVILKSNVSFKYNTEYLDNPSFDPKLPTGRYFDGGNHFISEIGTYIFTENNGTIQHLGLRNISSDNVKLWRNSSGNNNSRWGVLCTNNFGLIDNIRLDDLSVTYSIIEYNDGGNVFDLGTLVGSNSGTISDVVYGGKIEIKTTKCEVVGEINIGGIVGENISGGLIKDISPGEGNVEIIINNIMYGERAAFYVGGAIGQSSNNLEEIIVSNVTVDSSGSFGQLGNTGGLIGRARATEGTPSVISSCTVGGTVKGLPVKATDHYKAYSYTGGLVGNNSNFSVIDCISVCNVELVPMTGIDEESISYGTGGGFGRIYSANENIISGNYIYGSTLEGPESYIGNFAGIVPLSMDWDKYLITGNMAKEIISGKFIGLSIDDVFEDTPDN